MRVIGQVFGNRVGHAVSFVAHLAAAVAKRLFDAVDANVGGDDGPHELPRDGGLPHCREAAENDQHIVTSILAPITSKYAFTSEGLIDGLVES